MLHPDLVRRPRRNLVIVARRAGARSAAGGALSTGASARARA
jgi:hypothetical protein